MPLLNLGIVAHVDAGKTTLTERLLHAAGAIERLGSVDAGTTQTDTLPLERERGITIKSAVACFALGDLTVNLLDTPGHPDFIAEVERVLGVLDGAVLVVSAVEGVQPQTPLLMRALQRLRVPTLIFVNKIDRAGADVDRVLAAMSRRLSPAIIAMGTTTALGTRRAAFRPASARHAAFRGALGELLAERDDALLAAYVEGRPVAYARLRERLAQQTGRALVHPVFFGSAITGAGLDALTAGIAELLPTADGDPDAPFAGRAFKVERAPAGERIAYVRVFAGMLCVRDRVELARGTARVTSLSVFAPGGAVTRSAATVGEIARVSGLTGVQIGEGIGGLLATTSPAFPPPALESVVVPRQSADTNRLGRALAELAEQDPLINVRQADAHGALSVSLYGEVQKEVIGATLARDYGVDVDFEETTTIYVERPTGAGEALEVLRAKTKSNVTGKSSPTSDNPHLVTLGLRIEPAPIGSGVGFALDVDVRLLPLYVYKTVDALMAHMRAYVQEALRAGLHGWEVTDCTVTMFDAGYRAPGTTAADLRKVTPLVLRQALARAGTRVCEPMSAVRVDLPADDVGDLLQVLARLRARSSTTAQQGGVATVEARMPAASVHELQRLLPGLTGGEGVVESTFGGYETVTGPPPRPRAPRAGSGNG